MTTSQLRRFYTDPLAAAWMAKHFGMVFTRWSDGVSEWEGRLCGTDALQEFEGCRHFVIHPDSLHLLEPQVGDIGIQPDEACGEYRNGRWRSFSSCGRDCYGLSEKERISIIQRNGIAFHWPESEAA